MRRKSSKVHNAHSCSETRVRGGLAGLNRRRTRGDNRGRVSVVAVIRRRRGGQVFRGGEKALGEGEGGSDREMPKGS